MKELKKRELSTIFDEFKENNMTQYDKLYKEYYATIYGIVFPIIKDRESAEDVVQEIFIKIYNMDKEKFPTQGELSWLYTVSKNEALQFLRKKNKEINIEEIYEIKEKSSEIDKIIDINTYNKMISGLNEKEKQIVSLKILSDFTFRKIGQMLSMPTPTVQWKYYKAVDSLKISLGNLLGFIFAFTLLIGRRKVKNSYVKIKDNNNMEDNIAKNSNTEKNTNENINIQDIVNESSSDNIKFHENDSNQDFSEINEKIEGEISEKSESFEVRKREYRLF